MFETWTFGRKLAVAFAIAGLTLVIVAAVGYRSIEELVDNATAVAHTHQVRRDVADLLSLVKDAETGQRGYVITGDDSYLTILFAEGDLRTFKKDDY